MSSGAKCKEKDVLIIWFHSFPFMKNPSSCLGQDVKKLGRPLLNDEEMQNIPTETPFWVNGDKLATSKGAFHNISCPVCNGTTEDNTWY